MQIHVTYNGTRYESLPEAGPADFVAFERQFKVSASAFTDEENARFEWLCFMVYRGLRKLEVVPATTGFDDEFLDRIDAIDVVDDDEEGEQEDAVDPSVPAAPLT